jgi:hypothetical protein
MPRHTAAASAVIGLNQTMQKKMMTRGRNPSGARDSMPLSQGHAMRMRPSTGGMTGQILQ